MQRTDDLRTTAVVLTAAVGLIVAASVAVVVTARRAHGEGSPWRPGENVRWFELYAADRGAPESDFKWKLKIGPTQELFQCYALGAFGVNELNKKFPNKDFRGGCHDGERLTLFELYNRWKATRPRDAEKERTR
jgi:hypothetical protein